MLSQTNRVTITVVALVAIVALVAGIFFAQNLSKAKKIKAEKFHGTLLSQARDVNSFELEGTRGVLFNNDSLKGHWTMMFFGFTNCGYLCPTTMAKLGNMYRLLEKRHVANLPDVVMISIDPERDTLNALKHFAQAFHPNFKGARAEKSSIKKMTRELGIAYAKVALPNKKDAESYDIEHTGTILLFNPEGKLTAFFTTPHDAKALAEDYQLLAS